MCTRHHAALRAAAEAVGPPPAPRQDAREQARVRRDSGLPNNQRGSTALERRRADRRARRRALYEQVVARSQADTPKQRVARELGVSRHTGVAWLAAGHFPERARPTRRAPTLLTPYADQIAASYDGGGDNTAELARRLAALGYRGTPITGHRAWAALRMARPRAPVAVTVAGTGAAAPVRRVVPVPSPRQVAWLLRKTDAPLTDEERASRTALDAACPALAEARALGDRFVRRLHARRDAAGDPHDLGPWLAAAERTE